MLSTVHDGTFITLFHLVFGLAEKALLHDLDVGQCKSTRKLKRQILSAERQNAKAKNVAPFFRPVFVTKSHGKKISGKSYLEA